MKKNILVIVEGEKTEYNFFKSFLLSFEESFEIYCLGTNIYKLYKMMKEYDFNANIKDVLIDIHPEQREILKNNFVYTYLIFDCDAHHPKKDDKRTIKEIVCDNFEKLKEMSEYFTNETDPTIGKLYINYPMMESFRDCNNFFDDDYKSAEVRIEEISNYKKLVASKQIHSLHIDTFTKEEFKLLIAQNLYKLNYIENNLWAKPNYSDYLDFSKSYKILSNESHYIENTGKMYAINTSLFLIVDYYGNKNNFYDDLNRLIF